MTTNKNARRQFLKNTSLAALAIGLLPTHLSSRAKANLKPVDECNPTTLDYYGEGPFYTENPPLLENGQLADIYEPGTRLIITGRVHNLDCTEIIPDALIDIWHANDAGAYDNAGYNLRGQVLSNSQGFYMFETVYPGNYPNGGSYRPSHIHLKITPPGFDTLTTQLYFSGDPYIETDAAASITEGTFDASHRIIPLTTNNDGKLEGSWDIIVDGDGIVGLNNIHIDKGMIYNVSPNPFVDQLVIDYGVFKESKVSLHVYNMQGQQVATLEERPTKKGKYSVTWKPQSSIKSGYYFIALKINDLQVHYQKVMLQQG
jgi:protocatechuate 3,4-dioxygenase beta subunit